MAPHEFAEEIKNPKRAQVMQLKMGCLRYCRFAFTTTGRCRLFPDLAANPGFSRWSTN